MISSPLTIVLSPLDDVAVATRDLAPGVEVAGVRVREKVPAGHKVAIRPVAAGKPVRKYGQVIGFASADIPAGGWVHTHNLKMEMGDVARDYAFGADTRPDTQSPEERFFFGYKRADGRVGTRNYVAIVSSVNCSASVCKFIRDHFRTAAFRERYPHVDGVMAVTHTSGCCVQPGEPEATLQRTLAGLANHPNVAGALLVGLGCETNQVTQLTERYSLPVVRDGWARTLNIQEEGGVAKTVRKGIEIVEEMLRLANAARRTRESASHIVLAMNCGGSDGASGITANPALGVACDRLVRCGGTAVLAETPEIYGAEHLLTRRAISPEVGMKLVERVKWWEAYTRLFGSTIDNNPTFGNKQGGLTTIYEKSLGAVAKAGNSPLVAVYRFAEPVTAKGLCFMDTPGLDPVSMTGLIAGGCNLGAFTTGRGSVYGGKPSPCLKIATNTPLYLRMTDDMDINAGTILDGSETVETIGTAIFETLLGVASGETTKSEAQGIGDEEIAPWLLGPTL